MLRVKDDHVPSMTWKDRLLLTAVLGMAALGLSGLRGLAREPLPQLPCSADNVKASRPAFDLSYLPDDADAVMAIRPGALFGQPGWEKIARLINRSIEQEFGFRVEDIEQIVGPFVITVTHSKSKTHRGKTEESHGSMGMQPNFIRTTKDMDWEKTLEKVLQAHHVKRSKVSHHGNTYWKLIGIPRSPFFGNCFFCPDRRTLVLGSETDIRHILDRKNNSWPKKIDRRDWQKIDKNIIAFSISGKNSGFSTFGEVIITGETDDLKATSAEKQWAKNFRAIIPEVSAFMLGLDLNKNEFALESYVRLMSDDKIQKAVQVVNAGVDIVKDEIKKQHKKHASNKADILIEDFAAKLFQELRVEQQNGNVRVHSSISMDIPRMIHEMLMQDLGEGVSRSNHKNTKK